MPLHFEAPLAELLRQSYIEAVRRRHLRFTLEHVLYLLVKSPAGAILDELSADRPHLERELAEYLELIEERPPKTNLAPKPDLSCDRALRLACIHVMASGGEVVLIGDLLAALLRDDEAYASLILRAEGLSRVDVLRKMSHGRQKPPGIPTAEELPANLPVRVLLHNDPYTTMEFVIEVLEDIFQLPNHQATRLMLQVHQEGRAEIGIFAGSVAREKVQEVRDQAEEHGFPLLCTIER